MTLNFETFQNAVHVLRLAWILLATNAPPDKATLQFLHFHALQMHVLLGTTICRKTELPHVVDKNLHMMIH